MAKPVVLDLEYPEKSMPTTTTTTTTSSCSKSNYYNPPPTVKKISFSIVVISLPVLYVSLLHISPSSLFKDTNFWFLMSNAIILIVAADSGMFAAASSDEPLDVYQEYVTHSRCRSRSSELPLGEPPRIQWKGEEANTCLALVPSQVTPPREEPPKEERFSRSMSELVAAPSVADVVERKKACTRSASEKKVCTEEEEEEENDYAALSDEELNRRVEEFIKRLNREIRRQDVASERSSVVVRVE